MVSIDSLDNIIKILNNTQVSEIEIFNSNRAIKLKRTPFEEEETTSEESAEIKTTEKNDTNIIQIKSDTVGIYYRNKSKKAVPKIRPGMEIKAREDLGFIDCVNTNHPLRSPANGKILKVLVNNHAPVEYGQVLFEMEKK